MAKGSYWLPKGAVVKWNNIEIILDDETNGVLIEDADWPEVQRAHFPEDEWDEAEPPQNTKAAMTASMVSRDPNASRAERMADLAFNPVIVLNHVADPSYAPYCMRCPGIHRMTVAAPFLWEHHCGAIHDERQVLAVDNQNEGKQ